MSNRTYDAAYLAKGEQALIMRALKFFCHEQHVMIQKAYEQYKKRDPKVFEDHKQHHLKQVRAAEDLMERFRSKSIRINPEINKGDAQ